MAAGRIAEICGNRRVERLLSAGRGFETPTINELSYRSGDQGGLNFGLQPPPTTPLKSAARRVSATAC
jgi:hypothetical protein